MEASRRLRHAQLRAVEEEADVDSEAAEGIRTADLVRRATRSARFVAGIALALAAVSSTGTALLLCRLHQAEVGSSLRGSPAESLGLSAGGARAAGSAVWGAELPGYFRVYLNTVVRKDRTLQSSRVGLLTAGDRVFAVERYGRRVRIERPLQGWMSAATTDGVDILRPDDELLGVHSRLNASGLAQMALDPRATASRDAIRKRAAVFTDIEHKLISVFNKVNEFVLQQDGKTVAEVLRTEELRTAGKAVVELSKRTAQTISSQKQAAEQLLQQKVTPEARDHLIREAQKFSPERLFGKEGASMVDAWKEALGK